MKRSEGFSLIEMLVAIAVAAIVLLAVQGVVLSMSQARERLSREGEALHAGRVIFDRMGRELRSAYFVSGREDARFEGRTGEREIELVFASTAASPAVEGVSPGAVRLRYVWDGSVLQRQESVIHQDPATLPAERLTEILTEMRLRFHDGRGWHSSWSSAQQGGLPRLVEIELLFRAGETLFPLRSVIDPALSGESR